MSWSDVWILYLRELRSALRERAIVVNSIFLPIFLYPLLLWLAFTGITFVQGLSSREELRIAMIGVPQAHAEIADSLAAIDQVTLVDEPLTVVEATERVRAGELEAAVVFEPAPGVPTNASAEIVYDRAAGRSDRARERVERVIGDYRTRWLAREARALGAEPEDLAQFRISVQNVASGTDMGAFLLGTTVPLFIVIMVAIGCLYPAVDSTAGERERSTWETLMTVSASRGSVVVAKYLYVATLGVVAAILNVAAFTASMGVIISPMLAGSGEEVSFRLPLLAVPVMTVGAVVLALLFAAAMMIVASFARTFKDGQAMVMPIYWLAVIPLLLGQAPDRTLDATMALIPVLNIAQVIKDALMGTFLWPLIGVAVAEILVLVALCLWIARKTLQFEDHLMGSYDGSFWKFAKERLLRGGRPAQARGGA